MDPAFYTRAADDAGQRYVSLLQAFRSLLFAAISQPYSQAAADTLRANATGLARTYLKTESVLIADAVRTTAETASKRAQQDMSVSPVSSIPKELKAFLGASNSYLEAEITAQLSRDVEGLVQRFREFAIETRLTAAAVGGRVGPASIGALERERVRFHFRDRSGRLYPSQRFIRTVWRHTLVALGAEFYMMEATTRGAKTVTVQHPDPKSRHQGVVVSANGMNGGTSFSDVRDEIFHPQSDATLKAVP